MNELAYGIHWFRRDLRIQGNPALLHQLKIHDGRVLGLFILDLKILQRPDFSKKRFSFYLKTLKKLQTELRQQGGDLLIYQSHSNPPTDTQLEQTWSSLLTQCHTLPSLISFNRDYEPYSRRRDSGITEYLETHHHLKVHTERDHLLIEPHELRPTTNLNSFYQVFTPFKNRWYELFESDLIQSRLQKHQSLLSAPCTFRMQWKEQVPEALLLNSEELLSSLLKQFDETNFLNFTPLATIQNFKPKILNYEQHRDFPSLAGTSYFSSFFKNGSLTVPEVILHLDLKKHHKTRSTSHKKFFDELIWREFYYHLLYHQPSVETLEFQRKFRNLTWENNEEHFKAWCEGRTGYLIVDAAIRQLLTTGWMHNRLRMIVASFLTKDLLIDWRWGERFFMNHLIDGDLAANNGGWQWAASTGCDPQPYFRIFNPTLQSQKFDPQGTFIRQWLPEYQHLNAKEIHLPQKPIVIHSEQREKALKHYQQKLKSMS